MRLLNLLGLALALVPAPARAVSREAQLAQASPLYRQARRTVTQDIAALPDAATRRATRAALLVPGDCIQHRIGLAQPDQLRIVAQLRTRGLLEAQGDAETIRRALFPALKDTDSACPHLPDPVLTAPGGNSGSHHSWPGGLAVHLATNLASARALMTAYGMHQRNHVTAAILWHDWAKALVLRWRPDGTTEPELQLAGTGAHHVLGLAEAMRRGLDPVIIAAQACSHDAEPAHVRRWIEAAALIAQVDASRYPPSASPECLVTHLADQNWIFGDAALESAEALLAAQAARYGFDPRDIARYHRCYRNPILARFGADALFVSPQPRDWRPAIPACAPFSPQ